MPVIKGQEFHHWEEADCGYKTKCWLWRGAINDSGYGIVPVNRKTTRVHILMFEMHKYKVPKGLQLDHLCRRRDCCNPEHLEAVTQRENARRGSKAKISKEDVGRIRLCIKVGFKQSLIAEFIGTENIVANISSGRRWEDI